jgi:hypothetical protein
LNCFAPIKFIPEIESTSIDSVSSTYREGKPPIADVYIDGVWQIDLVAELTASCVLTEDSEGGE